MRGYGLADSDKTSARPGDDLALTATAAATPRDAAQIYPANYWYSLLEVPPASDFPGTGPRGNGIGVAMRTQADWVDRLKDGCQLCHQLGNQATREMPMLDLNEFDSSVEAWEYRIRAGGAGPAMAVEINRMGRPRALQLYADWSDRIAAGELPPVPPRPQGRERNLVLSMWAWGHPRGMVHDEVTTDKRNPTLNANGPVYGVGGAGLVITDTRTHQSVRMDLPTRIERPRRSASYQGSSTAVPSLYWGNEPVNLQSRSAHNPMLDDKGRLWITQSVRPNDVPAWCLEGSDHPSAQYYPIQHRAESRQVSYYDPETSEFELIDTCYFTHHLQFADDDDDTLWLSGSTEAIGWLNTRLYDETGDERASQGWCPTVIDTNGDGRITKPWNDPNPQGEVEIDPARDTRIGSLDKFKRAYGVIPHPDGSVWITRRFDVPGRLIRLDLGDSPPETCISEVYEPPYDPERGPGRVGVRPARHRRGPQRGDLDRARRQRPPRQLRPQQVHGAQRADGHGPALHGGLDAPLDPGAEAEGRRGLGQRGLSLLQLGRSVQHARSGRERADRHWHDVGRAAGARSRQRRVGHHARSLSAGLLQPRPRRPHRRCGRRLEGARRVVKLQHRIDVPPRGGQGGDERDRAVPDATEPTGELAARGETPRCTEIGAAHARRGNPCGCPVRP